MPGPLPRSRGSMTTALPCAKHFQAMVALVVLAAVAGQVAAALTLQTAACTDRGACLAWEGLGGNLTVASPTNSPTPIKLASSAPAVTAVCFRLPNDLGRNDTVFEARLHLIAGPGGPEEAVPPLLVNLTITDGGILSDSAADPAPSLAARLATATGPTVVWNLTDPWVQGSVQVSPDLTPLVAHLVSLNAWYPGQSMDGCCWFFFF